MSLRYLVRYLPRCRGCHTESGSVRRLAQDGQEYGVWVRAPSHLLSRCVTPGTPLNLSGPARRPAPRPPLTAAVPEVGVVRRVVLAQALQQPLVVHEPVQRAQQEGVERQVAHLLQLEVPAQVLQPPRAPDAGLQRLQSFAVLPQVNRQLLGWAGRQVRMRPTRPASPRRGSPWLPFVLLPSPPRYVFDSGS